MKSRSSRLGGRAGNRNNTAAETLGRRTDGKPMANPPGTSSSTPEPVLRSKILKHKIIINNRE